MREVCRIYHVVRFMEDSELVARMREEEIVLTVCPLSNVRLKVVERMEDHPLPELVEAGLRVTLNSDDPAYFGGGMLANFQACHDAFGWSRETFIQLAGTAIESAFISERRRLELHRRSLKIGRAHV